MWIWSRNISSHTFRCSFFFLLLLLLSCISYVCSMIVHLNNGVLAACSLLPLVHTIKYCVCSIHFYYVDENGVLLLLLLLLWQEVNTARRATATTWATDRSFECSSSLNLSSGWQFSNIQTAIIHTYAFRPSHGRMHTHRIASHPEVFMCMYVFGGELVSAAYHASHLHTLETI